MQKVVSSNLTGTTIYPNGTGPRQVRVLGYDSGECENNPGPSDGGKGDNLIVVRFFRSSSSG